MTTLTTPAATPLEAPQWLRLTFKYGLGTVLSLVLVYWLTQSVSAELKALKEGQQNFRSEQQATRAAVEQHNTNSNEDQKRTRALLYAICRNGARSSDARELCEVGR